MAYGYAIGKISIVINGPILKNNLAIHKLWQNFDVGYSVDISSAPTILRPWVRIPSTHHLRFIIYSHICAIFVFAFTVKRTKINKKTPGSNSLSDDPNHCRPKFCIYFRHLHQLGQNKFYLSLESTVTRLGDFCKFVVKPFSSKTNPTVY